MRLYRLKIAPEFLPNLIDIPEAIPPKDERPTFTFIARWDKRKRPWLFLDLAKQFPDYEFIAVGKGTASAESEFDAWLRQRYIDTGNLEMTGFINRFTEPERLQRILSKTWALVNTAAREGLPLTFLEAAAFGCSIISAVDPDGFASRFGVQAKNDDFASAIKALLKMSPLEKGQQAHDYVRETYETSRALQAHITQYLKYCR